MHSAFGWRWEHLTAIDQPASEEDEAAGDTRLYRVAAKNFAQDVGTEHGNFDFLMGCDIDLTREDVREELYRWGRWFIEASGVEGFRIDAAKHMSASFLRDWLTRLRDDTGRELFSVCEFAIGELGPVSTFLERTGGVSHVFDHILHFTFGEASKNRGGFDLRQLFEGSVVREHPRLAVTFVDNHDSDPAQGKDEWVDDWFKPLAYAAILLREGGLPCVFAGDYDGREADGEDTPGLTSHRELIDKLIDARRRFGFGEQDDYFDDPRHIAWVRHGNDEHPGQMIVQLNTAEDEVRVTLTGRADTQYIDLLRDGAELTTDAESRAEFGCPAGGVAVWVTD